MDLGIEDEGDRQAGPAQSKLGSWLVGTGLGDSFAAQVVGPKPATGTVEEESREDCIPSEDPQSVQTVNHLPFSLEHSTSNGRRHETGQKKRWYTRLVRRIKKTFFLSRSD